MNMEELLTAWICGNRKDVAAELLLQGPGNVARFAARLMMGQGMMGTGCAEAEHLARILDGFQDEALPSYAPPETPF